MTSITLTIPKQEKNRLARIASRYGLSLQELSRHVLAQLSIKVPLESLREYEHPITLKQSILRGYKEAKSGKVRNSL